MPFLLRPPPRLGRLSYCPQPAGRLCCAVPARLEPAPSEFKVLLGECGHLTLQSPRVAASSSEKWDNDVTSWWNFCRKVQSQQASEEWSLQLTPQPYLGQLDFPFAGPCLSSGVASRDPLIVSFHVCLAPQRARPWAKCCHALSHQIPCGGCYYCVLSTEE